MADPVPGVPAGPIVTAAGFPIKNLTPLGHSARNVPYSGHGLQRLQLGPGVQGQPGLRRHVRGLPHHRRHQQVQPGPAPQLHGLQRRPGRRRSSTATSSIRSWDSAVERPTQRPRRAPARPSAVGFEGIHVFDISDPANPVMIKQVKFADNEQRGRRAPSAAARTPRPPCRTRPAATSTSTTAARAATCAGIDIVKHQDLGPDRRQVHQARRRTAAPATPATTTTCCSTSAAPPPATRCAPAATASRCTSSTWPLDAAAPGGVENPTLLWSQSMGVTTGHSGSFTYDGKYLIYGHEPGGGSAARCQATSTSSSGRCSSSTRSRARPRARCCTRARRTAARTAPGTTSTSSRPRPATTRRWAPTSRASRCSTSRTRRLRRRSPTPIRPR